MKVYDIRNAGPNHRFTVRGKDGKPFIVSNCCQALARIVMTERTVQVNRKWPVVLSVHDELVALGQEEDVEQIHSIMTEDSSWLGGMPVGAETKYGTVYGEIK